jgi:hypothetical protein
MKLRTGDPWMPGSVYGRSLRGLTLNLLVRDIATALPFHFHPESPSAGRRPSPDPTWPAPDSPPGWGAG